MKKSNRVEQYKKFNELYRNSKKTSTEEVNNINNTEEVEVVEPTSVEEVVIHAESQQTTKQTLQPVDENQLVVDLITDFVKDLKSDKDFHINNPNVSIYDFCKTKLNELKKCLEEKNLLPQLERVSEPLFCQLYEGRDFLYKDDHILRYGRDKATYFEAMTKFWGTEEMAKRQYTHKEWATNFADFNTPIRKSDIVVVCLTYYFFEELLVRLITKENNESQQPTEEVEVVIN